MSSSEMREGPSTYPPFKQGGLTQDAMHSEIEDMNYGTSVATCSASVRLGFIRKVYGILAVQLAITTVLCAMFMYIPPLRSAIIAGGAGLQILLMIASIVTIIGLIMNKDSHPQNMYWLLSFTVIESLAVGYICAVYQASGLGGLVLEALALTLTIFACLTAYCFISKKDFSFMGGALFAGLIVLLGASIINVFLGFTGHSSYVFAMLVACGGALLFSLYILYDSKFFFAFSVVLHNSILYARSASATSGALFYISTSAYYERLLTFF